MATTIEKKVSVKGKGVVAELDIVQYESVQEAIDAKDEKWCLACINRMVVTDSMNAERAKHREGELGKKKRRTLAFNLLPTLTLASGKSGMDALIECAGNEDKLNELLMSEEIQAAVDAAQSGA